MKSQTYAALTLIFLCFAGTPALAQQQRDMMPHVQSHAVNPGLSLSAPAASPLQQDAREDYATGLMMQQHETLQHNPSGLNRPEMAIGRAHNGYAPC
jgi:hypothetical protein